MNAVHQTLAAGRWNEFSLAEQLGNIGSEISRASRWHGKNQALFQGAQERAFELLDLTIQDRRWQGRLKELTRAREVFSDAISGGEAYGSTLDDLDRYFLAFALAARRGR